MKNRQRGRNGGGGKPRPMGGGGGPNRNPNFDGGNMRPRGNAQQLMEKFLAMARDASAMGDRVAAENYFQHADHYYRVLNARFEAQQQQQHGGGYNNGQRPQHGPRYDRDPNEQGGENQAEGQGYDRQDSNRQDYNRPQQGNYGGSNYGEGRPSYQDTQPAPESYQQPAYQPAPEPVPVVQADREIGLPPTILGMAETPAPQPQPTLEGASEEHRAPRRRRGRGQGPAEDASRG